MTDQPDAVSSTYATAETTAQFAENIRDVRTRIDVAAQRAGRSSADVRLLPVSKTVPEERIRLAVEAGATFLGENKVQEALRKSENLADIVELDWAVIGHLQTNKAKYVARFAAEFHALDSMRLAEALQRRLDIEDRTLEVYVQVNTSGEQSKFGLEPADAEGFVRELASFDRLNVAGFMTLAVFSSDEERVRRCFTVLRELRDRVCAEAPGGLQPHGLSMGMSGDFEAAIDEGATTVRVGQAIFGSRALPDSYYWPTGTGDLEGSA
ncbi:YggS family pyridoxal phosphate-dependent enzyme [Paramicrobacterium chengjingii]|uniref:Pyridoxal phosphate homeostasis protein n=1 Tax=Paramicrobacterium chengjingii TaxID=2769067 RepID=A0ABX6YM74_9MICO|nr:YggS family pyridoxal phosphate-dependent enzyme [Microbacterium chengjingii]QPZ39843.1 YggS family pyridoxal phosphate-dependent enzyme [Microbacterium chengjingii]